ncbi:hypothetical protein [Enterococcus sp. AZ058]|uniref:hypothetical protein n=1 Tax=unclassified Enterococcus TaxID=2608891 RepID=UPI003D2C909E
MSKKLDVSKTQIINWKNGKDFPSPKNLASLKKLLGLKENGAFLMYQFDDTYFLSMFLASLERVANERIDDFLY